MRKHAVGQRGEADEDPFFGNAFGRVIKPIVNLASAMPALVIAGRVAVARSLPHWGVLVGYAIALYGWHFVYLVMGLVYDPDDEERWGYFWYTAQMFSARYLMPPTWLACFVVVAALAVFA